MKKLILGVLVVNLLAACGTNPPKQAADEGSAVQAAAVTANPQLASPAGGASTQTSADAAAATRADAGVAQAAKAAAAPAVATIAPTAEARAGVGISIAAVQEAEPFSVFFPFDVDAVQTADLETVLMQARILADNPSWKARVEGNADERGSSEYNLALGQRRANNTKKALVLGGASLEQVETVSFGEEKPRATGHDEDSWAQNRRADIVVSE